MCAISIGRLPHGIVGLPYGERHSIDIGKSVLKVASRVLAGHWRQPFRMSALAGGRIMQRVAGMTAFWNRNRIYGFGGSKARSRRQ